VYDEDASQVEDEIEDDSRYEPAKLDLALGTAILIIPIAIAFLTGSTFYQILLREADDGLRVIISLFAAGIAWAITVESILWFRSWKSPF
jgi:hypothetical protein